MDNNVDSATGASTYLSIRGDIIFGELPPGSKLTLAPLRDRYGSSIPTLREVLNRLTSEGFVVLEDQKGFQVAPVSVKGLKEIASLRELLETSALQDSFKAGSVDWESSVLAAHHRLATIEAAMIRGEKVDVRTWKECDRRFHAALIAANGSDFLIRTHNSVFDHYLRYQMLALGFRGKPAAEEHRKLLDAALARDVPRRSMFCTFISPRASKRRFPLARSAVFRLVECYSGRTPAENDLSIASPYVSRLILNF